MSESTGSCVHVDVLNVVTMLIHGHCTRRHIV